MALDNFSELQLKTFRPTCELRFIHRMVNRLNLRILQQKWISDDASTFQWRDIPLVDKQGEPYP